MPYVRRASAAVVASALGFASGWLSSVTGGSVERAPAALTAMVVGLGGAGICLGALLGWVGDKAGASVAVLVLLAAFYLGTVLFSPYHSPAGDVLLLVAAAMPAGLTTVAAFHIVRRLEGSTATQRQ